MMDAAPWLDAGTSTAALLVLAVVVGYTLVAEPWLGTRFMNGFRRATRETPGQRGRWFAGLLGMQAATVVVCVAIVVLLPALPAAGVGIRGWEPLSPLVVGILGGALVGVLLGLVGSLRSGEVPSLGDFEVLLPRSGGERVWLAGVSIGAGVSEELLYRGVLPALAVGAGAPVGAALVGQAAVFGLAHHYQGWKGVVATGMAGLGFGLLVILTGSLLPAILIHILVDLRLALGPPAAAPEPTLDGAVPGP